MVTASDRAVVGFSLSGGQAHDAPEGIALLEEIQRAQEQKYLWMDRAYEGENVREAAVKMGFAPVVPPKKTVRTLGTMTKSDTSGATKLSGISCA